MLVAGSSLALFSEGSVSAGAVSSLADCSAGGGSADLGAVWR